MESNNAKDLMKAALMMMIPEDIEVNFDIPVKVAIFFDDLIDKEVNTVEDMAMLLSTLHILLIRVYKSLGKSNAEIKEHLDKYLLIMDTMEDKG